ncbi:MAG: hypothetical protein ACJA1A_003657 [Saprospiraceae bacterium]|jgi:hypothetical protein
MRLKWIYIINIQPKKEYNFNKNTKIGEPLNQIRSRNYVYQMIVEINN